MQSHKRAIEMNHQISDEHHKIHFFTIISRLHSALHGKKYNNIHKNAVMKKKNRGKDGRERERWK